LLARGASFLIEDSFMKNARLNCILFFAQTGAPVKDESVFLVVNRGPFIGPLPPPEAPWPPKGRACRQDAPPPPLAREGLGCPAAPSGISGPTGPSGSARDLPPDRREGPVVRCVFPFDLGE
jgi:hypothetical protein